jgi:hypothetical protein
MTTEQALIEFARVQAEIKAYVHRWEAIGQSYEESEQRRAEWGPLCDREQAVRAALMAAGEALIAKREAA